MLLPGTACAPPAAVLSSPPPTTHRLLHCKQIKEANPKLGKQAKVMATSMDRVYDFARTPRRWAGG